MPLTHTNRKGSTSTLYRKTGVDGKPRYLFDCHDLLESLADPNHPEHDWMMEWAGGPIDPEAFDLDMVNNQLARLP